MIFHSLAITSLIAEKKILACFDEKNKYDQKYHKKDKVKKQRDLLSYFSQSGNILKY